MISFFMEWLIFEKAILHATFQLKEKRPQDNTCGRFVSAGLIG
jgi:hypothetical protein